jgi:hypothetical protein
MFSSVTCTTPSFMGNYEISQMMFYYVSESLLSQNSRCYKEKNQKVSHSRKNEWERDAKWNSNSRNRGKLRQVASAGKGENFRPVKIMFPERCLTEDISNEMIRIVLKNWWESYMFSRRCDHAPPSCYEWIYIWKEYR